MRKALLLSGAMIVALAAVPAIAELQSTPAEKAQTRALNLSGASGTYASPQTLNGEKVEAAISGADRSGTRPNPDPNDFVALKTVDPDRLGGASVEDASGVAIGRVTDVTLARDGTPAELTIELNGGRSVRVSEAALRYNPNDRTLLTKLDIGELRSTASAEDTGE
jgi:hypothetical protein